MNKDTITMTVIIQSSVNADGFRVMVEDNVRNVVLFNKECYYGYNASYTREQALNSEIQAMDAEKYGWDNYYYKVKPYTTDIICNIAKSFNININDIIIKPGKNAFAGSSISSKEVERFKNTYLTKEEIMQYNVNKTTTVYI